MSFTTRTSKRHPLAALVSRSARRSRARVFWDALPVVLSVAGMVASLYLGG